MIKKHGKQLLHRGKRVVLQLMPHIAQRDSNYTCNQTMPGTALCCVSVALGGSLVTILKIWSVLTCACMLSDKQGINTSCWALQDCLHTSVCTLVPRINKIALPSYQSVTLQLHRHSTDSSWIIIELYCNNFLTLYQKYTHRQGSLSSFKGKPIVTVYTTFVTMCPCVLL